MFDYTAYLCKCIFDLILSSAPVLQAFSHLRVWAARFCVILPKLWAAPKVFAFHL